VPRSAPRLRRIPVGVRPRRSPPRRRLPLAPRAVSFRAVALGLGLVPLLCWWSIRAEIIYGGSELIEASLLVIVVFVLFGLTLLNEALRTVAPRFTFSQGELLTTYVMLTTSVGIAGLGQMQFLPHA